MKPRLFLDSFRGSFRGSLRESLESLALLCPTALYGPPPRVQLLPWNLGPGRIFLRRTARALPSGRVFPLCAHAAPTLSSGPAPRGVGPCRKASRGAALQPSMMDLSLSLGAWHCATRLFHVAPLDLSHHLVIDVVPGRGKDSAARAKLSCPKLQPSQTCYRGVGTRNS